MIMGEALGSIKSCCLQLEERTITARSAAADRLGALLGNARICAQIDEAGKRDWSWQVCLSNIDIMVNSSSFESIMVYNALTKTFIRMFTAAPGVF